MAIYKKARAKEKCDQLIKTHYLDHGMIPKDRILEKEILSSISPASKVLDAGCGYDAAVISKYCNLISEAVGVDLAKEFQVKPGVRTYTANLESLPFEDDYFDMIISRDVCEHLAKPLEIFGELKRVLKPGGKIIMITPNKYSYSSVISALLPTSFKKSYLRRFFGEKVYDNFPTFYLCNTKQQIRRIARKSGLIFRKLLAISHPPYYLMFSAILLRMAISYDKVISRLGWYWLQSSFLFVLVKKER